MVSIPCTRTLKVSDGAKEWLINDLEEQYPHRWIAIEITEEVNQEPTKGRLLGTAMNETELAEILREYEDSDRQYALLYGSDTAPYPGPATLKVIEGAPEQPISEIEEQNPNVYLVIEITEEVDYEPTKGRLLATAAHSEEFVELLRHCIDSGRRWALRSGVSTQPTRDYIL